MKKLNVIFLFFLLTIFGVYQALACTRIVYKNYKANVITARSMDFSMPIPGNIWVFPRGMEKSGETGELSTVRWTSKYGSVVVSSWDIAVPDGMNEKGLMANMLWLNESKYPDFVKNGPVKGLSISLWAQYVLDNFATVKETVEAFRKEEFVIVSDKIPGTEKMTTIHLSVSDATGDNAIFEYIDGKLIIHHSDEYNVMTNSPAFEKQLSIKDYWNDIDGFSFMPGTNKAADRFARANFYLNNLPAVDNTRVAIATAFSLIRHLSVPYGIQSADALDLSTTRWRVVADQTDLVYYYEDVLFPNTIWIDLKKIDFSKDSSVRILNTAEGNTYAGEVNNYFKETAPFKFQGL